MKELSYSGQNVRIAGAETIVIDFPGDMSKCVVTTVKAPPARPTFSTYEIAVEGGTASKTRSGINTNFTVTAEPGARVKLTLTPSGPGNMDVTSRFRK